MVPVGGARAQAIFLSTQDGHSGASLDSMMPVTQALNLV